MNLYQVVSVKPRRIKCVDGYFTAENGYVVYAAFHRANSANDAIESAKAYYMDKEARQGKIRAEFMRAD